MPMSKQMRTAGGGVLRHQMATDLEQAAPAQGKQRGAADRQVVAELLGGAPGEDVMAAVAAWVRATQPATQRGL